MQDWYLWLIVNFIDILDLDFHNICRNFVNWNHEKKHSELKIFDDPHWFLKLYLRVKYITKLTGMVI